MRYLRFPILLIALALGANAAEAAKPPVRCPIDRATYSAIGKSEFELQFRAIENPKVASEIVSLTLQHRDRGTVATYNLGGSMGYGSYYLRDLAQPIDAETDSHLKPVFFDTNWGNVTDVSAIGSPKYLFISGLGANDWYSDRASNRTLPLGEVMWQFSGCRK